MEEFAPKKRKSNNGVANSVPTRSICFVPEDLMFEIFLGIPLKSTFQYRLVSKQCLSILSNPIFISTWMKTNNYAPWTALVQDCDLSANEFLITSSPMEYSKFTSNYDGFSFEFLRSKVYPENLYILSSNNGLVLCATTKHYQNKYYVCNPLMKTSVLLPVPPTYNMVALCGLVSSLTSSDSLSSTKGYDVIRIPQFSVGKTTFSLEIYSSKSGGWNGYEVLCSQEVTMPKWLLTQNSVIAHDGVLYLIEGRGKIIACDIKNNRKDGNGRSIFQCRFIASPEEFKATEPPKRCLGEIDGRIVFMYNRRGIWLLDGNNNNSWISYSDYKSSSYSNEYTLAFDGVNKNFVITNCTSYGIKAYDHSFEAFNLRTRKLLKFEGHPILDSRCLTFRTVVLVPLPTPL